jgi:hypothetical protein
MEPGLLELKPSGLAIPSTAKGIPQIKPLVNFRIVILQ